MSPINWKKKYNNLTAQEYLSMYNSKDISHDLIIQYNKELIKEYPFLLPQDVYTGKVPKNYDYSYTWLDDMPQGWRLAFGENLLNDLKQELEAQNYVGDYQIIQIKEKFGGLRWYDNGCTTKWAKEILPKYEELSFNTCIECGQPAKYETKGWITPLCENCAIKQFNNARQYYEGLVFENYVTKIEDM